MQKDVAEKRSFWHDLDGIRDKAAIMYNALTKSKNQDNFLSTTFKLNRFPTSLPSSFSAHVRVYFGEPNRHFCVSYTARLGL